MHFFYYLSFGELFRLRVGVILTLFLTGWIAVPSLLLAEVEQVKFIEGRCMSSFTKTALLELRTALPELENYSDDEILESLGEIAGFKTSESIEIGESIVDVSECPNLNHPTTSLLIRAEILSYLELDQELSVKSNDANYGSLWGVHGTYGVGAPSAWEDGHEGQGIVVAVVDSGVDPHHPDLQANMWRNTSEIAGNGIDDDGNGYIDDVHGWNAINSSGNSFDDNSHGTHCAGTIAAVRNNNIGIAGVAPQAKIMAIKFLSASGSGYTSHAVAGLAYVLAQKQRGVNVRLTNNSWGGGGYSTTLRNAILAHQNAGILFVAAAGNDTNDNDVNPSYPASYTTTGLTNMLVVAAHSLTSAHAWFTNWGATSVHISAPGVGILSTVPGSGYSSYNGTSMATPHVAGAAAVLFAANPLLNFSDVRQLIRSNGKVLPSFNRAIAAQVEGLDLSAALAASSPNQPPVIAAIPDQYVPAHNESGSNQVAVSDSDGTVVSCQATVLSAAGETAINFHQTFAPYCASVNCEDGAYEAGEKRLYSLNTGDTFSLSSTDELYLVTNGARTFISNFTGAYENPELLTQAENGGAALTHSASCSLNDNGDVEINYAWPANWWGEFSIQISVTDNEGASSSRTFTVFAESDPPAISPISAQSVALSEGTVTIPFMATDPEGDPVTCTATRASVAVNSFSSLYDTYKLRCITDGCLGPNGTKLFIGGDSSTLILNSSNALFRHAGGSVSQLGVFAGAFNDPSLLTSPARAANITFVIPTVSDSNINVNYAGAGTGPVQITLTCASRGGTSSASFQLNITTTPPTITKPADDTSYPGEQRDFPITLGNSEGATTLTATIGRNFEAMARQIKQNYNPTDYFPHLDGWNGFWKFFWNRLTNSWFTLSRLTDDRGNEVIIFSTYPGAIILGTFPASWEDPNKFINPQATVTNTLATSVNNGVIRLTSAPSQSNGEVEIVALASKGHYNASTSWLVEYKNEAPTVEFESLHSVIGASPSLTVPLTVSDEDGQNVTVQVIEVQNLSAHLAALVSSRKLELRPTESTIPGGYWLYSATHGWHAVTPGISNEGPVCHLRGNSIGATILASMPESYCEDPQKILKTVTSVGTPTANVASVGNGEHEVTISTNGATLTRVTLSLSDGITQIFTHIFVSNSNGAPLITGDATAIGRPGIEKIIPLSLTDPDGDTLTHTITQALTCGEKARDIALELGLRYHSNCTAASKECETNGIRYLYSSALRKVIYLLQRNGRAVLAHDARARQAIAYLPVKFFFMPELLVEGSSSTEAHDVSLSSTTESLVDLSVTASDDVCVTIETTDGKLKTLHDLTVYISSTLGQNGEPILDSDRDGISDDAERSQGTNVYDAGDRSHLIVGGKPKYAVVSLIPGAKLFANLTNAGTSSVEAAFHIRNETGDILSSFTRQSAAGSQKIPLYTSSSGETVQVNISLSSGTLAGYLTAETNDSEGALTHISSTSFLAPSSSQQHLSFSQGETIFLTNISPGSKEAHLRFFDADGAFVDEAEVTVPAHGTEALSLSRFTTVESGSITVQGQDVLAHLSPSGHNTPLLSYTLPAQAGSGGTRTFTLQHGGKDGFEEQALLTLVSTISRAGKTEVRIFGAQDNLLQTGEVTLAPHAKQTIDLSALLAQEGALTVTLLPTARGSVVASLMRTLTEGSQVITQLEFPILNDTDFFEATWHSLLVIGISGKNGGSGEINPGEVPIIEYKEPERTAGQFRATIAYLDPQGRPLQNQTLQICSMKKGGKIRCSKQTIQTNQNGEIQITAKKRKLQRMYLKDQFGNLIRVWQKRRR